MEQYSPHRAQFSAPDQANATQSAQQPVPHPISSAGYAPYQPTPAVTPAPYPAAYVHPAPYAYPVQNVRRVPAYPPPSYPTPPFPQAYYPYAPPPQARYPQTRSPQPAYSQPAYPQPPYPRLAYPQPVYPQIAYPPPYALYPRVPVTPPERDNEINAHGYKESPDYPKDQARIERLRARVTFFAVIALLVIFFFTPLPSLILPDDIGTFESILATFAFEIVLIVGAFFLLRRSFPRGWRDTFGLQKPRGISVLIGAGSGIVALNAAGMLAAIFTLLGADLTNNNSLDEYANIPDWQAVIAMLIFVPILAPLFEELLFRGILVASAVRAFPGKVGFFVAIIATGLVFGSLHFPGTFDATGAFVVILISCLGMFLAWLRLRTNSALVTMATHAIYNGLIVLLQLLLMSTDIVETAVFF